MRLYVMACAVAALVAVGCGGSPTGPSGGGMLRLMLTDSPFSEAQAVLVTFSEVTVHQAGGEWSVLPFADAASSRTCDLKKLEGGAQDVLGVGTLPPGHYTQVRLVVERAELYFDGPSDGPACAASMTAPGEGTAIEIPSGEVKLNRQFDLTSDGTTMLLDFDGDKSIHATGNGRYMMTPVIAILSVQ